MVGKEPIDIEKGDPSQKRDACVGCKAGHWITEADAAEGQYACHDCSLGMFSPGWSEDYQTDGCQSCPGGEDSLLDRTGCGQCAGPTFRNGTVTLGCAAGTHKICDATDGDDLSDCCQPECDDCRIYFGAFAVPNADKTGCECPPGHYAGVPYALPSALRVASALVFSLSSVLVPTSLIVHVHLANWCARLRRSSSAISSVPSVRGIKRQNV
eukprot:SAG11_NODE_223_length_12120_cov_6.351884_5_plen_212_part_00